MQKLTDIEERRASLSPDTQDMVLHSWVPQLSNAPFGMYQLAGVRGPKMSRKKCRSISWSTDINHQKLRCSRDEEDRHESPEILQEA